VPGRRGRRATPDPTKRARALRRHLSAAAAAAQPTHPPSPQVDDDASPDEIKQAYRSLAKECHPDYKGEAGHNMCILLNEAYETLMDEGARSAYNAKLELALADEEDTYTGTRAAWGPGQQGGRARA
jgi:hypothetical protein